MTAVDDAMLFGRQMADQAHRLFQDKGMSSAESTSHFLDEIGKRVRDMDAAGRAVARLPLGLRLSLQPTAGALMS